MCECAYVVVMFAARDYVQVTVVYQGKYGSTEVGTVGLYGVSMF